MHLPTANSGGSSSGEFDWGLLAGVITQTLSSGVSGGSKELGASQPLFKWERTPAAWLATPYCPLHQPGCPLATHCPGYEEQKQQIEEMVLLTLSYPEVGDAA